MADPRMHRLRHSPIWMITCALCMPGLFIFLPDLVMRYGGFSLLFWALASLLVTFPMLSLSTALSYTLRSSPAKNLRRVHRSLVLSGVAQTALIFLGGLLLVVVSAWSWTIFADMFIDLVSGRGSRLGDDFPSLRQQWTMIIGESHSDAFELERLSRPLGGLLIVAVLLWLGVHQFLINGIKSFNGLIQALTLGLVLGGGALVLFILLCGLPLFLSPNSTGDVGLSMISQPTLRPLGLWTEFISLAFLSGWLGTAFIGQLSFQDGRSRDPLMTVAISVVALVLVALCWMLVIGAGESAQHFFRVDGQQAPGSSIELLFLRLPMIFHTLGGSALAMTFLAWLGILTFVCGLLLLRTACVHLQRDMRMADGEIQSRMIIVGLGLTLPFCTQGGVALWYAMVDGLRFVLLPILLLWIWWGLTAHLGFSGLFDYHRSSSSVPVGFWFLGFNRFVLPFICSLYVLGSLAIFLQFHAIPSFWNPLLSLLPSLTLVMYLAWYRRREWYK